jgi:hypothetical protein
LGWLDEHILLGQPKDILIVITLQQSIPFEWDFAPKKLIYDSLRP